MRILYLGDIVGRSGRDAVTSRLPDLRRELSLDFVAVNGENAAGGFGITAAICNDLFGAGTDCILTGNHVFDQREIMSHFQAEPRLIRPANYPAGTPGRGVTVLDAARGKRVAVIQVMGRVFMDPLDCPFTAADRLLNEYRLGNNVDAVILDIHGEATSEKMAMGHFCDGRASLVAGTHSHVPTADAMILDGGTGYITDVGMCGDYNSVIGMEKDEPVRRFRQKTPGQRFSPASGPATVCGVLVETDDRTGLAKHIGAVRIGGKLSDKLPSFSATE